MNISIPLFMLCTDISFCSKNAKIAIFIEKNVVFPLKNLSSSNEKTTRKK